MNLCLICADVWQKSSQYCKVIILQLKKKKNLLANTGDIGSIPGLGRLHMQISPRATSPEPMCFNYETCSLWGPQATATKLVYHKY